MSTADEVLQLLTGSVAEVVERVAGIRDHSTLIVMHLAERRGRIRRKVLDALEARGLELEAGGATLHISRVERDVADLLATMAFSRPSAAHLDDTLQDTDPFPIPPESGFVDPATGHEWDFMAAPDLEAIAEALIEQFDIPLSEARDWKITYLWRKAGTMVNGKARLAATSRASGAAGYFAGTDFLVIASADYLRGYRMQLGQMKALVFHELKHITTSETYGPALVGHDAEVFYDELEFFGAWRQDLEPLRGVVLQMPLPGLTGP